MARQGATKTAAVKTVKHSASKPAAAPVKTRAATAAPKARAVAAPVTAPVKNKAVAKVSVKPETEPKEKVKKAKLVRDSFTMPEAEYAVLGEMKKACLKAGVEVKKSELLRVGVALIRQLDIAKLKTILESLPTLKAGRPKKNK